ncbi:hypothetical protein O6H91_01G129000 [Diphasiastrum complanatum]|uniref:Uncharacterized protein n=1 Tax=Diphasiastrum complanatum TaxID=34168 RepID=A0ACC2EVW0_DIPCM|nr:hypothetical protein O6H91_01G129000 [Diphasiastrum complanatum]
MRATRTRATRRIHNDTKRRIFFGNRWFGSPKLLNPVEAFLQTSVTFKRLEAAKEEIFEKTPSPPISNSLCLREGINLPIVGEYALWGLNWGYKRSKRPAIGVAICLSSTIGCAAAAGIYKIVSPLGKDFAEEDAKETTLALDICENGGEVSKMQRLLQRRVSFASREGKLVENPERRGGLFDFKDDPGSSLLSTICCVCVFGWNMDRLGFGNRYVHIVTFLLICSAPFFVLNLAAVNIGNNTARKCLGVAGIVLGIFGLMYGGYWSIKMLETFDLPAQTWCCNEPNMTDCTQWMFCSVCSLCQEVRTAEYYQVKDEKFYLRPVPSGPSP